MHDGTHMTWHFILSVKHEHFRTWLLCRCMLFFKARRRFAGSLADEEFGSERSEAGPGMERRITRWLDLNDGTTLINAMAFCGNAPVLRCTDWYN